jgi:MOSC domain-containing protein YiiM
VTGIVQDICISDAKGETKQPVVRAEVLAGHGIVGDAHAGDWPRQISLLPVESIAVFRERLPDLAPGAFAENIVTRGFNLGALRIGDRIRLGGAVLLEVTQIGKECHEDCEIRRATGDCIMPREGIFCRVLVGGSLQPGDRVLQVDSRGEDPS